MMSLPTTWNDHDDNHDEDNHDDDNNHDNHDDDVTQHNVSAIHNFNHDDNKESHNGDDSSEVANQDSNHHPVQQTHSASSHENPSKTLRPPMKIVCFVTSLTITVTSSQISAS